MFLSVKILRERSLAGTGSILDLLMQGENKKTSLNLAFMIQFVYYYYIYFTGLLLLFLMEVCKMSSNINTRWIFVDNSF